MTANITCHCGKISGTVKIILKDIASPIRSWNIKESFYISDKGDRIPMCTDCHKYVHTVGDWK